jgi:hypothetical protein
MEHIYHRTILKKKKNISTKTVNKNIVVYTTFKDLSSSDTFFEMLDLLNIDEL